MERFRGGLVFKAHRLLYQSTLGSRVINKKKKDIASHLLLRDPLEGVGFRLSLLLQRFPFCAPVPSLRILGSLGFLLRALSFGLGVSGFGRRVLELRFRIQSGFRDSG